MRESSHRPVRAASLAALVLAIVVGLLSLAPGGAQEGKPPTPLRSQDPLLTPTGRGYEHLLETEPPPDPPSDADVEPAPRPAHEVDEAAVLEAKQWAVRLLENTIARLEQELDAAEGLGATSETHNLRIRLGRLQQVCEERLVELGRDG